MKYSMSTREVPTAEPEGFPGGSCYISPCIPTRVIIQTFSISKHYSFNIDLPGRSILEGLIFRIGLAAGLYFPVLPGR